MDSPNNPINQILEMDQHNIEVSRKLLQSKGLLDLLERIPGLFDALEAEIAAHVKEKRLATPPSADLTIEEKDLRHLNFILRISMAQTARMQFIFAVGHLLRGHTGEIFSHARSMIESAGIAHLSLRDPELATLYIDDERGKFTAHTKRDKILPKSDQKTMALNDMYNLASSLTHNNFRTIIERHEIRIEDEQGRPEFTHLLKYHDVDEDNPSLLLQRACWLLNATILVLSLLTHAFQLEDCVLHRRIEHFDADLKKIAEPLYQRLSALEAKV